MKLLIGFLIAGYSIYNIIYALYMQFESIIFAAFRYEGLLFYNNALINTSNAFFYLRDWSTSFLPAEHPLLYFHNLDLIHFFAGFTQYYFRYGKEILFVFSLIIGIAGLMIAIKYSYKQFEHPLNIIFILSILIPLRAFNVAPQNLFSSATLLVIIWHVVLLKRIWDLEKIQSGFILELAACFLLAALAETNLVLLLLIITALCTVYSFSALGRLEMTKRSIAVLFSAAFPFILLRVLQLVIVKAHGYWELYKLDVAYTSKIKVNSDIVLADAIHFYSQHGLTFFGQTSQKIANNISGLTSYYYHNYGYVLWYIVILVAVSLLILKKLNYTKNNHTANIVKKIEISTFMAAYICFFTVASYCMVFLSGNVIIGLSLSEQGILYYQMVFNAFLIIFIPSILFVILKELDMMNHVKTTLLVIAATVLFAFLMRGALFATRMEHFSYKEALQKVHERSDIITNFEPSIIAIEAKSRANMSWYENSDTSCDLLNSRRLIKLYKVQENQPVPNLYVFLCFYPPYGVDKKEVTLKKHCMDTLKHETLYEDRHFGLYKIEL